MACSPMVEYRRFRLTPVECQGKDREVAATLSTISVIRKADRPCENESPSMNAAIPERRPATEEISGLIERVTFHNDESGFCVLRVKAGRFLSILEIVLPCSVYPECFVSCFSCARPSSPLFCSSPCPCNS